MSDDVIPSYSLVMNTNYWPLKGGPFFCKLWRPPTSAERFSSRSQGRRGDSRSWARSRGGAPDPRPTPGIPRFGADGEGRLHLHLPPPTAQGSALRGAPRSTSRPPPPRPSPRRKRQYILTPLELLLCCGGCFSCSGG